MQTPTTTNKHQQTPNRSAMGVAHNAQETVSADIVLSGNFGEFTEDEMNSGVESSQGYAAQYPFSVTVQGANFEVQNSSREVFHRAPILNVILWYGHPVYRLHAGTLKGLTGDTRKWDEEDRKIVAQSYGNPFGRANSSRGNFDAAGYGKYLDNKELRTEVKKRQYCIISLPGILPPGSLAICFFGATAMMPFNDYASAVQKNNVPLSFLMTQLSLNPAKNDKDENYMQLVFRPLQDKAGKSVQTVPSAEAYRAKMKPYLDKIVETHKEAMRLAESNVIPQAAPSVDSTTSANYFEDEAIPDAMPVAKPAEHNIAEGHFVTDDGIPF